MKKRLVIVLGAVLIMALGVSVAFGYGWGWNPYLYSKLTDDQKAEVDKIEEQIFELQKQLVQKQAEFGLITEEQAQLAIDRMELAFKYRNAEQSGDVPYGYGRGPGGWAGCWGGDYGPMGSHMWGGRGGRGGGRW